MKKRIISTFLTIVFVLSMGKSIIVPSVNAATGSPVTITVDRNTTYQEVEGFGFFGGRDVWWNSSGHYKDEWGEMILSDLGITMWRNEIYPGIPVNSSNEWTRQKPVVEKLSALAKEKGEDLKVILTVWSPPGEYKVSINPYQISWPSNDTSTTRGTTPFNKTNDGGTLNPNMYSEYSDWLISALEMYRNLGVEVYALSLQNEPFFSQSGFNSCAYTRQWYVDLLNNCVPKIKEEFPNIKIFGSENMLSFESGNSFYHSAILADSTALNNLDVFAVHGYTDGVLAGSVSSHKSQWTTHLSKIKSSSKPNWMTETSGYADTWLSQKVTRNGQQINLPGALELGVAISSALKYGKISAWVFWQGSGIGTKAKDEYSLMDGERYVGKRYMISKHFYRFIRPGAKMLESLSSDNSVLSTSFYNETGSATTHVLVNTSASDKVITFSGESLPNDYDYYVTTSEENTNVSYKGIIKNGEIALPRESIITLVNGDIGYSAEPDITEEPSVSPSETSLITNELTPEPTPTITSAPPTEPFPETTANPTDIPTDEPHIPISQKAYVSVKKVKINKVSGTVKTRSKTPLYKRASVSKKLYTLKKGLKVNALSVKGLYAKIKYKKTYVYAKITNFSFSKKQNGKTSSAVFSYSKPNTNKSYRLVKLKKNKVLSIRNIKKQYYITTVDV